MRNLLILAMALLAGCATSEEVVRETSVVDDFVVLAELEQVDRIRDYRDLRFKHLNETLAAASDGNRVYLIQFDSGCWALKTGHASSAIDFRRSHRVLHRRDTVGGCAIDRIYVATDELLEEIKELAKMPTYRTLVPKTN